LSDFEFSGQTFDKYSNTNFVKICPVEAEWFHVDGQTKLTVVFHNYANAPKNREYIHAMPRFANY